MQPLAINVIDALSRFLLSGPPALPGPPGLYRCLDPHGVLGRLEMAS